MENKEEVVSLPAGTFDEWDDSQWLTFKNWLKNILFTDIVEIIFTKRDGSERTMICTLRGDLIKTTPIPVFDEVSADSQLAPIKPFRKPAKISDATLRVFDTEVGEWRSFRVRSIKNIYTLILKYGKDR